MSLGVILFILKYLFSKYCKTFQAFICLIFFIFPKIFSIYFFYKGMNSKSLYR